MVDKFDLKSHKIYKAAQVLELNEKETLAEIKKSYRNLIKKWHPDKCEKTDEICKAKTKEIVKAYKIIIEYCQNYRYSFKKENIINNLPVKERGKENMIRRFGNDPLWGNL